MSKRVLGDGATCCGKDCDLCASLPESAVVAPDEEIDGLDLNDEPSGWSK